MKTPSKAGAVVAGLIIIAGLSGCSGGPATDPDQGAEGWYTNEVHLPDGTSVTCVATYRGGVTCDWDSRD